MDTIANKDVRVIEHHCLQMPYAHLRVDHPKSLAKLMVSMEHYGQLVPVIVVTASPPHQWVLIDGYQRVNALKRLGKDTVEAEVWSCSLTDALLMLLKSWGARSSGILEEALLLHELYKQHSLSQQVLARRVGRDQSWVSRRLALLEPLSEAILEGVSKGALSVWVGARILAPMARAIPDHATCLLGYLLKHPRRTREVYSFYEHYQRSSHSIRTKMVEQPDLFFKAQRALETEKQAIALKKGPEGQWREACHALMTLLSELRALAPSLFFRQTREESRQPLQEFSQVRDKVEELTQTLREGVDC
jgi:ParB/RepB/Spo0J family partition protein